MKDINIEILATLNGQAKEDFKAGLRNLRLTDPQAFIALKESFRKAHPEWNEKQVEIAARGRS